MDVYQEWMEKWSDVEIAMHLDIKLIRCSKRMFYEVEDNVAQVWEMLKIENGIQRFKAYSQLKAEKVAEEGPPHLVQYIFEAINCDANLNYFWKKKQNNIEAYLEKVRNADRYYSVSEALNFLYCNLLIVDTPF